MATQAQKKIEPQPKVMRARDIINELVERGVSELMIAEKVGCTYITVYKWRREDHSPSSLSHRDNLARLYRETTGKSVVVSSEKN